MSSGSVIAVFVLEEEEWEEEEEHGLLVVLAELFAADPQARAASAAN